MEKKRLVIRVSSKNESRKNLIHLTTQGKKVYNDTSPILLESVEKIQKNIFQKYIN